MDQEEFEAELYFATSMREEPDFRYWAGYRRGLLRARYGARVSSTDNHFAWRAFKVDDDPIMAELGRGYIDGINTVITGQYRAAESITTGRTRPRAGLLLALKVLFGPRNGKWLTSAYAATSGLREWRTQK